ncbi:MAG: 3'-5' exonuclease domain-containing protein 2, partial [Bacteroidales bacterium]|nr:3'-5' exonuclease domain-containing protein 2 [Bacteroidales bacterium]
MQAYPTCISKDAISELPLAFFPGSIVVVETDVQVEKALAFLSMQRLVGFDTETKPVFSKGKKNKVALMQVATEDVCFLFRLNTIGLSDAI